MVSNHVTLRLVHALLANKSKLSQGYTGLFHVHYSQTYPVLKHNQIGLRN